MAAANESSRIRERLNGRFLIGVLGILLASLGFSILAGPLLVALVGTALIVVNYFLPAPFAFALGQLALVGMAPIGVSLNQLVIAETGLLVVLVGPALFDEGSIRLFGILLIALGCLGMLGWGLGQVTDVLWRIALVLAGSIALAAYGLHRYERVQLDLVRKA